MTGSISVTIKDGRNSYSFVLHRNITILRGDSGKGKTTLYDMVSDYNRFGKNSGTKVICNRPVLAIGGENWQDAIEKTRESIIIIDEDNSFIRTKEFAEIIRRSDNYYLLITRGYLEQLPISVTEIYELTGNKNKQFTAIYTEREYMYNAPDKKQLPFVPEVIITEDSNTGHQFFKSIADKVRTIMTGVIITEQ